ncbi:hypothetical protein B9T11_07825 [Wohlfahrtiimonas chitiniclastica]|uniref:phage tail tube protein n=1 Tax=Wohlfahrtiimonas chitiniclastica TaxID=400946 RepID=UPI000B994ED9|nr:phage tail tube protein [Wohlfahrtiimonas chitiniclastica]MBS7827367.1 hypothetical protein [Wohlfahrtiimonas chitiniclastica]MBS7829198.1 hypothetical protein [Wohlfahrtiimonas chitiniclastica]MBS7835218.1 hypothetical protein [Wohlfahrtiimonas chitiniclastica]MBS7837184.1 hypothetical protein [Wohlfahrtiimonas chitiniclastica]OYQ71622.1 hypothetical protein B9T13_02835 [Wohlfahrtiimonas chitiniclastica]
MSKGSKTEERGIWTQGTQLYMKKATGEIVEINDVTAITFPEVSRNQINVTTIKDKSHKKKMGLADSGEATFTVILDPNDEGHQYLTNLANSDTEEQMEYIIGLDDGFGIDPTVDEEKVTLPTTRTWYSFVGALKAFNPTLGEDEVVRNDAKIEVSGKPKMTLKKSM